MPYKMNVKKGDRVKVISGKDRGAESEVLRAFPREGKVIVEGVATVKKAQKPTAENQNGGWVTKEAKIDVSNVMLICPECDQPTRVGHGWDEDGTKVRICKKCGAKF